MDPQRVPVWPFGPGHSVWVFPIDVDHIDLAALSESQGECHLLAIRREHRLGGVVALALEQSRAFFRRQIDKAQLVFVLALAVDVDHALAVGGKAGTFFDSERVE